MNNKNATTDESIGRYYESQCIQDANYAEYMAMSGLEDIAHELYEIEYKIRLQEAGVRNENTGNITH